jgi:succinate dehydrogenase / fumarate reductase, membrane anchor subunit
VSNHEHPDMQTPMAKVRFLGAARSGTKHFWHQRLTSVALIPLTIGAFVVVLGLMGRNHAAVVQILGSTPIAVGLLLFVLVGIYHMWLGMQTIIEDYVHEELPKIALLMGNTFFSCAIGLAAVFAILKLSFGL